MAQKHKTPTLTQKQRESIEALGVALERGNMAPTPARIMALLLVSPVVELPFDDIQALLNLSKSATSNSLNQLLALNKIEYVTHPGERRRYFRSHLTNWKGEAAGQLKFLGEFAALIGKIAADRPASTPEFNRNLSELVDFLDYLTKELAVAASKWEKRH